MKQCSRWNDWGCFPNGVPEPPANLVLPPGDPQRLFISELRHEPQEELDHRLNGATVLIGKGTDLVEWWETNAQEFPFLRHLARAVFVVPASSSPSERIWSAADDLSGDDRASVDEETLDARLVLKKNVPIQAQILGKDCFDVL